MTEPGCMNIINLDDSRPEEAALYDGAICPCGEAWFVLHGDNTAPNGAVAMTKEGAVTGSTGRPHCMSCGHPYIRGA